jgi:hypothetical protein
MPKISEYDEATALDDDDVLVVVEDGVTKKLTVADLRQALGPAATSGDKLAKWTFCK